MLFLYHRAFFLLKVPQYALLYQIGPFECSYSSLSTPMGVDYVVMGFDMEVQPLVTHNAARPLCVSAIFVDHLHVARALLA